MPPSPRTVSKFLSLILRHDPERFGVRLDEAGWTDVGGLIEVLRKHGHDVDRAFVEAVVRDNDKQRFALDGDRIRANQGHSYRVELGLVPRTPPRELFHGTAETTLDAIRAEGLRPMSRQHVHLSHDAETARRVGSRHGRPVVLRVDCVAMQSAGFEFLCAENGVWLVERVPPEFLQPS